MNLSKSLYTRGIQCPKSLWLKKYNPEVLTPPDDKAKGVFETGNLVGEIACELFPNGKEVPFNRNYDEMIRTTNEWLDEGVENIYEATFNYQGILVMVDILHIDSNGEVSIYEVKSSTEVKDIYLHDVSIQYYVLKNLGFNIKSANVIHINNKYIRDEALYLDNLFKIADVTDDAIALQENIPNTLKSFENYLSNSEYEPKIDIDKYCKKPYDCDAREYCWKIQKEIPDYSIFNIFNLGSAKQKELYNQGIVKIEDIPDDFKMTENQTKAVKNHKSKTTYIDNEKIKDFVSSLSYPIYHLDFETFQQAIPQFNGIKPFEQIPFQYSIHIEQEDGTLEHKEFLAEDGIDPREQIAQKLCEDIPTTVTVLAYNMSFEKGVIEKLASSFNEYSSDLLSIHSNIKDLMIPFRNKDYETPDMQGSYSIKYVLPALVPEMKQSYKELDGVQNGSQAMNAFANLYKLDDSEKQKVRKSLLEYCKLDTLAMVKILEKLREIQ